MTALRYNIEDIIATYGGILLSQGESGGFISIDFGDRISIKTGTTDTKIYSRIAKTYTITITLWGATDEVWELSQLMEEQWNHQGLTARTEPLIIKDKVTTDKIIVDCFPMKPAPLTYGREHNNRDFVFDGSNFKQTRG